MRTFCKVEEFEDIGQVMALADESENTLRFYIDLAGQSIQGAEKPLGVSNLGVKFNDTEKGVEDLFKALAALDRDALHEAGMQLIVQVEGAIEQGEFT